MSDNLGFYFLLLRLKASDINFVQFLVKAKAWAKNQVQRKNLRPFEVI